MVPWKCVKMFKPSRTRGQRERLTKAFRGEGFSVIGQLSFRLWRGGRGGFEWFSVRGWRRLSRESEGEGALRIPCANNSHRVRGVCFPFLCRQSPCTRASLWGSTDLSKRLQQFTSTWSGKSRLRCSWYEVHVGGVKWGQRAIWGGVLERTQMISKKNSSNWKDNQGIERNKLLFLVPELQHRNVQEKKKKPCL